MSSIAEQPSTGSVEPTSTSTSTPSPSHPSAPSRAPGTAVTDRIEREVSSLAALEGLPLAEHADAYQQVHAELQRALAEIDGA